MTDVTTTPRFGRVSAGRQMSIDPVSLQIGECYFVTTGRVRRVTNIEAGRVFYEERRGPVREGHPWPRRADKDDQDSAGVA